MTNEQARKKRTNAMARLRGLGTTADEVAAALKRRRIRGTRLSSNCCPIAKFLGSAEVCQDFIDLCGTIRITPPRAVRTFIDRFDDGRYPELAVE